MEKNNISTKEFWCEYGIFVGILAFFFLSLFGMIRLSQKSWDNGLRDSVTKIIQEKEGDKWIVGKRIELNSITARSSALFELRNKENVEKNYAIILRSATLFGHFPAVYIYNKTSDARFVGYALADGKVGKILDSKNSDSSVSFWIQRIPSIIKNAEGGAAND